MGRCHTGSPCPARAVTRPGHASASRRAAAARRRPGRAPGPAVPAARPVRPAGGPGPGHGETGKTGRGVPPAEPRLPAPRARARPGARWAGRPLAQAPGTNFRTAGGPGRRRRAAAAGVPPEARRAATVTQTGCRQAGSRLAGASGGTPAGSGQARGEPPARRRRGRGGCGDGGRNDNGKAGMSSRQAAFPRGQEPGFRV